MSGDLKKRDYKSFGPVAKVRFRPMCEVLGFKQVKPTQYLREREGWVDFIILQTSQWGGNNFEIIWGIKKNKEQEGIDPCLSHYLKRGQGKPSFWNRFTKADIEQNAKEAHQAFILQAEPFLKNLKTKKDVGWYYWDYNETVLRRILGKSYESLSRHEKDVFSRSCSFLEWAGLENLKTSIMAGKVPASVNLRLDRWSNLKFIKFRRSIM